MVPVYVIRVETMPSPVTQGANNDRRWFSPGAMTAPAKSRGCLVFNMLEPGIVIYRRIPVAHMTRAQTCEQAGDERTSCGYHKNKRAVVTAQ